jgi:hypothetical protein
VVLPTDKREANAEFEQTFLAVVKQTLFEVTLMRVAADREEIEIVWVFVFVRRDRTAAAAACVGRCKFPSQEPAKTKLPTEESPATRNGPASHWRTAASMPLAKRFVYGV